MFRGAYLLFLAFLFLIGTPPICTLQEDLIRATSTFQRRSLLFQNWNMFVRPSPVNAYYSATIEHHDGHVSNWRTPDPAQTTYWNSFLEGRFGKMIETSFALGPARNVLVAGLAKYLNTQTDGSARAVRVFLELSTIEPFAEIASHRDQTLSYKLTRESIGLVNFQ